MPTAVQIGAGKIGRGFLGRLLRDGGFDTTFVDTDSTLLGHLSAQRSYPLRLVSAETSQAHTIDGFQVSDVRDSAATAAFVSADLVCTAVGVVNLPQVARQLAHGINARACACAGPLDILLCENQWHAATLMRDWIAPHIDRRACSYFQNRVGLVETVIGIMVPMPTDAMQAEDPLLLVTEPFDELPVARDMLRGPIPRIPGLIAADDIEAYEARKLYLHNMGHAALAYLGYQRGYECIWQCAADRELAGICREAMAQTSAAVTACYGFPRQSLQDYCTDLLRRFRNKALGDTVTRVAADPLRKLRRTDRLIGAASLCAKMGTRVDALATITAAALLYDDPADSGALELQDYRQRQGDVALLQSLCGIDADSGLSRAVCAAVTQLVRQKDQPHAPE